MFPGDVAEEERIGDPKPMEPFAIRFIINFWRPTNAPVKMKRMLSVRTLYVSGLVGPDVVFPGLDEVEDGPPESRL